MNGSYQFRAIQVILVTVILLAAAKSTSLEPGAFPADPGLADYLAWADEHHPGVARAAGRSDALRSQAAAAGALPDLKFGWGEMIVPVETRVGPQQRVLSLSQGIPWFGTLGLKEKVAEKLADAAVEDIRGQKLRVRHQVRAAWFDLAHLLGEISIIGDNLELARQIEATTRSTYEAGAGSLGDVLGAQIEIEQLTVRLAGLRDRIRPVTARLNQAAGLEPGHRTPSIGAAALDHDFVLPPDSIVVALLESHNPDLAALRLEKEGRRQSLDLAGRAGYPDLTLGVDYIMTGQAVNEGVQDSGKDPVIARLGLSIPLWGGRVDAEKKASASWLAAASANLSDTRRQLNARLENALYEWRQAGRNVDLYGRVLLDSGRQALDVTSARYRSGLASYADLVTSRNTLLGLELAHLRAVADRSHALNDLATLVGVSIVDLQSVEAGTEITEEPREQRKE